MKLKFEKINGQSCWYCKEKARDRYVRVDQLPMSQHRHIFLYCLQTEIFCLHSFGENISINRNHVYYCDVDGLYLDSEKTTVVYPFENVKKIGRARFKEFDHFAKSLG